MGISSRKLLTSLLLVLLELAAPEQHIYEDLLSALEQIDFTQLVINGMLAFLLFAGAFNLDLKALRSRALQVGYLAVVGTALSTVIIGLLFWGATQLLGIPLSLPWALVFGALISPTDPVAVLTILRGVGLKDTLRIEAEGGALFNDGVGIVLFTLMIGIAAGGEDFNFLHLGWDLAREAGGGILLGLLTG